jgi:hypothetical protein
MLFLSTHNFSLIHMLKKIKEFHNGIYFFGEIPHRNVS